MKTENPKRTDRLHHYMSLVCKNLIISALQIQHLSVILNVKTAVLW
jgi:hypothetical protein